MGRRTFLARVLTGTMAQVSTRKILMAVAAAALALVAVPASAASHHATAPYRSQVFLPPAPGRTANGTTTLYDPQYGGYTLSDGPGFTFVNANLTVPSITCASPEPPLEPEDQWLIGLGGQALTADPDFAGVLIAAVCDQNNNPAYTPYVEVTSSAGQEQVAIPLFGTIAIAPGDDLYMSVNWSTVASTYTLKLNDNTQGTTYSTTVSCAECAHLTANVLTQTFQNTAGATAPDFGTASFSKTHVQDENQTSPGVIDQSSLWTVNELIDYGTSTSDIVVQPSSITDTSSGSAFTDTWKHKS